MAMNTYQRQLLAMLGAREDRTRQAAASRPVLPKTGDYALAAGRNIIQGLVAERDKQRQMQQLQQASAGSAEVSQRNKAINDALGFVRAGYAVPPELAEAAGMPHLAKLEPKQKPVKPQTTYRTMINPATGKPHVYRIRTLFDEAGQPVDQAEPLQEAPVMSMFPSPMQQADYGLKLEAAGQAKENDAMAAANTRFQSAYKVWQMNYEGEPPDFNRFLEDERARRGLSQPAAQPTGGTGKGPRMF